MAYSVAQQFELMPPEDQKIFLAENNIEELVESWQFWARPEQLQPEEILLGIRLHWLCMAGRGWGKTHVGSKTVEEWARELPGIHIGIIGRTMKETREVMIEGVSGILSVGRSDFAPRFMPGRGKIYWPNGSMATLYSADQPSSLRGPQHHKIWGDELCAWSKPDEAFDMAMFGLRLGDKPQSIWTTTPRPIPTLKELMSDELTYITRGATHDNASNLSPAFIKKLLLKYEGTRLGRQEIYAEVLDDHPGALWTYSGIEGCRTKILPNLIKIAIAIDPALTKNKNSDETGIVVVGLGDDGACYVLDDLSGQYSPYEWAKIACEAYHQWGASMVVCEVNAGGDLVKENIHTTDPKVPVDAVRASVGKYARAEPVATLYETGKVHHHGCFPKLEDQMATFDPEDPYWRKASPDRLDALVWGVFWLKLRKSAKKAGRRRVRVDVV